MTIIKNLEDINKLRQGGKILASILHEVAQKAVAGTKTIELDILAEKG